VMLTHPNPCQNMLILYMHQNVAQEARLWVASSILQGKIDINTHHSSVTQNIKRSSLSLPYSFIEWNDSPNSNIQHPTTNSPQNRDVDSSPPTKHKQYSTVSTTSQTENPTTSKKPFSDCFPTRRSTHPALSQQAQMFVPKGAPIASDNPSYSSSLEDSIVPGTPSSRAQPKNQLQNPPKIQPVKATPLKPRTIEIHSPLHSQPLVRHLVQGTITYSTHLEKKDLNTLNRPTKSTNIMILPNILPRMQEERVNFTPPTPKSIKIKQVQSTLDQVSFNTKSNDKVDTT